MFVAIAATACAAGVSASVASCTFGEYDGSFDSAGLETGVTSQDSATGPGPATSIMVDPGAKTDTTLASSDAVFSIVVPSGAYAMPVTITITPLGEHAIDTGFIVPSYAVTVSSSATATLPVQVVFTGDAPSNGGNTNALAPVTQSGAALTLLPIVGATNGMTGTNGQQETVWGLTKNLAATYTLTFAANIAQGNPSTLTDPSSANCIYTCCGINNPGSGGGGNAQLYGTDVGCACAGTNASPAGSCFAQNCADIAATAQRCLDLRIGSKLDGGGPTCPGAMGPMSANCGTGSECCYQPGGPNGGFSCGTGGGTLNNCSYVARCSSDAQCASGVCCAYDDEAICSTACPPERHVCATLADAGAPECNGGACKSGGKCGIHTCGATPSLCQ